MIKEIEGIILNEMDYKETSKIINVLTKDGVIGVLCKGAKSMKSPLRALTMQCSYSKFYIYYKENGLSLLKDVDLYETFNNIKKDIMLIAYASYLTDLINQVAKNECDEELFKLLLDGLFKINDGFDPLVITNIIELKCLKYLGVELNLDGCVVCGDTKDILTIDGDLGGFICKKCYNNEKIVDLKVIKLLRMYCYVDIKNISKVEIEDKNKKEINYFLNRYYERYTGIYLKSKKFLNDLNNF